MNDDRHEEEAIRRQIDEDMERFEHLSQEDLDRRLDQARIANDDELRHFLNAPRPTPEPLEGLRRDFIEQAFRALEPEHQAAMRQFSAAMPLPDAVDSLRKELADTRDRTGRISLVLKQQTGKAPRIKRPRATGKMLTVAQMAEALTLSSDVVYKMCEAGEIPGVKRMPTGAKKNNTWRADPVIFEKWRTSPDRRVKK
jgi:hypothetical protein